MKEVEIEPGGVLKIEEKEYFGGTYSLLEKIRMNGVGSPKIIYESGIPVFDDFVRDVEGELSFVSFELLKNGLILRLNRKLELRCAGTRLSDIEAIRLVAFRIEVSKVVRRNSPGKIVHRGILEIFEQDNEVSTFNIFTQNFQSLLKFFQKKPFEGKLAYSISDKEPEKDDFEW